MCAQAVDRLINYDEIADTVDSNIGKNGYVGTTSKGAFSLNTVADDARQRWLNPDSRNTTLENNGNDVKYETDFRSVYARVIDNWLAVDSVAILGGNFRSSSLSFV